MASAWSPHLSWCDCGMVTEDDGAVDQHRCSCYGNSCFAFSTRWVEVSEVSRTSPDTWASPLTSADTCWCLCSGELLRRSWRSRLLAGWTRPPPASILSYVQLAGAPDEMLGQLPALLRPFPGAPC